MTSIAVCSPKGSPGVTTLATAFGAVWPVGRPVVLVECDPSGGDLAARLGLSVRKGTTSYVLSLRHSGGQASGIGEHVQRVAGGLDVLPGPVGFDAASALDRELGGFPRAFCNMREDLVIDCGQLLPSSSGQWLVLEHADLVLVMARLDAAGIAHARVAIERVRSARRFGGVKLVTCGGSKAQAVEAASILGLPLGGSVPFDSRGASILGGRPGTRRKLVRSPLIRSTSALVRSLLEPEPSGEAFDSRDDGSERIEAETRPERLHQAVRSVATRWGGRGEAVPVDRDRS